MSSAADPHFLLRRVERQHALVEHLATRSPRLTTAQDLAHGLGLAVRTVERDLARLRAAGGSRSPFAEVQAEGSV